MKYYLKLITFKQYLLLFNVPYAFATCSLILFVYHYFEENNISQSFNIFLLFLILLRLLAFATGILIFPLLMKTEVDMYLMGMTIIYIYINYLFFHFKLHWSLPLAIFTIWLGYFLHVYTPLNNYFINNYNFFGIYNYIVIIGISLFSITLVNKVKETKNNMEKTNEKLIAQLKLNATLKDNINTELEKKVKERTEQFDTFIYRASHDIRGPL